MNNGEKMALKIQDAETLIDIINKLGVKITKSSLSLGFLFFIASSTLSGLPALSQSTEKPATSATSTPLPSEIQQQINTINAQKALIDALIQLRTSETNLIRTEFPQGQSKPLEGKLEGVNTLTAEPQILAYQASKEIAKAIGKQISANIPSNAQILIYDKDIAEAIKKYRIFNAKANDFLNGYENLFQEADLLLSGQEVFIGPGQISAIVTSALSNLGDVLAFFRVDRKFSDVQLTKISEETLVSQLVNEVKKKSSIKIHFPKLYLSASSNSNSDNTITQKIAELKGKQAKAREIILQLQEISSSKSKEIIDALNTLNTNLDNFLNTISESNLTEEILASSLIQNDSQKSYVLYLNVILTKGNTRESNSFFTGRKVRFSANVAVEYMLFDSTGPIVVADTVYYHTGFKKIDSPESNIGKRE